MSAVQEKKISRLPFLFIIGGMIGFILFHLISAVSLMSWLEGGLRGPSGWFQVHLFVLGWATMLAMGAVYQLIHVILQSEIYSKKLGYVHFVLFTIGLTGLLYGFQQGETAWIGGFASLTFAGILLFTWNMAVTLLRARQWNPITISAACAVLYLLLTGLTGMLMGLNFAFQWFVQWHERLFGAHIWLGTVGWFGLLITGFSYKMLPMFYLSHRYSERLQPAVLWLWNAGVIAGAAAFLSGAPARGVQLALLLLAAAAVAYFVHLLQIRKARHKKNPGEGIRWSMAVNAALAATGVIALMISFIYPEQFLGARPVLVAGWLYLGGWVSFNILCYASKIVPFLWWTWKYGNRIGTPGTPTMADLLDDKKVHVGLCLTLAAFIVLILGLLFDGPAVIVTGGLAFSVAAIGYIALIGSVFAK